MPQSAMRHPGPGAGGGSRRSGQATLSPDLPTEADGRSAPDVSNRRQMFFFGTLPGPGGLSERAMKALAILKRTVSFPARIRARTVLAELGIGSLPREEGRRGPLR